MGLVMAVSNQKGGVGKTVTAINLSYTLATLGERVLLLDLDPQGNATFGLGPDPDGLEGKTAFDVLMSEPGMIELSIHDTSHANLKLIPANVDLAGAEVHLTRDLVGGTVQLRRALQPIQGAFDFIVIDCPPSLGILTLNALMAATDLLIPIQTHTYALKGMKDLMVTIKRVSDARGYPVPLLGVVITQFQLRTTMHQILEKKIREYFGPKVFETVIHHTVRVQESTFQRAPLLQLDPESRPAQQYLKLAEEVRTRVKAAPVRRRTREAS
jgi:chromosome partitioning protein